MFTGYLQLYIFIFSLNLYIIQYSYITVIINQSHNQLISVVFYIVGNLGIDIFYKNIKCDRLQENEAQKNRNFFFALTELSASKY